MSAGYFLRCLRTRALLHGPFANLHRSFEHYVPGETDVVIRKADGTIEVAWTRTPFRSAC